MSLTTRVARLPLTTRTIALPLTASINALTLLIGVALLSLTVGIIALPLIMRIASLLWIMWGAGLPGFVRIASRSWTRRISRPQRHTRQEKQVDRKPGKNTPGPVFTHGLRFTTRNGIQKDHDVAYRYLFDCFIFRIRNIYLISRFTITQEGHPAMGEAEKNYWASMGYSRRNAAVPKP